MGNTRKKPEEKKSGSKPAKTPEGRENQLVALAVDLAEQQIKDGTASAQVISHFLKLGSTREQLEQERIRNENLLLEARVESLASQGRVEELYKAALSAFGVYSGNPILEIGWEDDET